MSRSLPDSPPSIMKAALLIDSELNAVDPLLDTTSDWPVFLESMPDSNVPDNAICIYEVAGKADGRIHSTGESVYHPGVVFRVRGSTAYSARRKLSELCAALDRILRTSVELDGEPSRAYRIQSVKLGPVLSLGPEDERRRRFSFTVNAVVTIKET